MRKVLLIATLALAAPLLASPAFAQLSTGVRAGISFDPDQVFFGGHVETRPLVERVTFRPNAELGFGDDLMVVALNFEFVYSIPIQNKPARLYLGAGPAINVWDFDDDRFGNDAGGVEGGFNFLVGVQHNRGLFGELKVGFSDSPDLKLTVGYAFR